MRFWSLLVNNTNAKKVEVLKEHRNDALVSILIWNFDETVISMLPEGGSSFNKNDAPYWHRPHL